VIIATVMNYDDPAGVAMCKGWLYLARRFNPHAKLIVFHHDKIGQVKEFGKRLGDVEFERIDVGKIMPHTQFVGHAPPSQDMTIGAWVRVEEMGLGKFLFAEADAWILGSLEDWWHTADQKPYISVIEQHNFHGADFFNAGTYSYNSKEGFVTYRKMMEQYEADGNRIAISLGDQGLLNAYFRRIGYDWSHPRIGVEYNAWARNCRVIRADDSEIRVMIGTKPVPRNEDENWIVDWAGWNCGRQARILHAFWRHKFWNLPECGPLWHYVRAKVAQIEG